MPAAACGDGRWTYPVQCFIPWPCPISHLLPDKAKAIPDPFEQVFFLLVQIPYLQPFEDVNKRVVRIGANIPLIKQNLCPLSFVDVPERSYVEGILGVYELNKIELLLLPYRPLLMQKCRPKPVKLCAFSGFENVHVIINSCILVKERALRA